MVKWLCFRSWAETEEPKKRKRAKISPDHSVLRKGLLDPFPLRHGHLDRFTPTPIAAFLEAVKILQGSLLSALISTVPNVLPVGLSDDRAVLVGAENFGSRR